MFNSQKLLKSQQKGHANDRFGTKRYHADGPIMTDDPNAFEALVIRWQKALLASAFAITRNYYMAEDTAQDAFTSAWMKLDCLRKADKFGARGCRIAKNRAKNIVSRYRGVGESR